MHWLFACVLLTACGRLGFAPNETTDDATVPDDIGDVDVPPGAIVSIEIAPPDFSTTSYEFVDVPGGTLTIPPSPGQLWLLLVTGYLTSDSMHYFGPEARYLFNGTEVGLGGTESMDPMGHGGWQHFYVFAGTPTPSTIQFQLGEGMMGLATLHDLHAVAIPLPVDADPQYSSFDGPLAVTSTTYTDIATFSFSAATPGDYLVLLLANASESPSTSDIDFRWTEDGVLLNEVFKNPRGAFESTMLARRVQLTPTPKTYRYQALAGNPGDGGATAMYVRALALRLDGFAGFGESYNQDEVTTSSGTPVSTNLLTVPSFTAPQYLVFGSMRIDGECPDIAPRAGQFTVDGNVHEFRHLPGNCSYETTYGHVELRSTPPSAIAASVFSTTGTPTTYEESMLLVLGVP